LRKVLKFSPSGTRGHVKFGRIALIAGLATLAVLAATASIGGAATPAPTLSLIVVPKPAVTAGQNVLGVLKFEYLSTASPTTLTGVYVLVDIPASSEFKPAPLSSPNCTLESLGKVRCDLGNVRAGETRRMSVVVSAPGSGFTMSGTAYWNENVNGSNPLPNNHVGPVSDTTTVVTGSDIKGACQTTVGTSSPLVLDTSSGGQRTLLSISKQAENFPCTPASAGVEAGPTDPVCGGAACTTQTSFVFFPSLLDGATATVTLDFPGSALLSGTTPKKFVLYQLLGGPQGVVVADCGTTPNASPDSCIVSRGKFGIQGVELVLRVFGSLIDPRYVG
jgi:hypothetical protein